MRRAPTRPGFDGARLADDLAALLHGGGAYPRLSDAGLVAVPLLRMARRLLDLETGAAFSNRPRRLSRAIMSAPHPLNQAVIAQALHDLRNGQLRRCKAMGFGRSWTRSSTNS